MKDANGKLLSGGKMWDKGDVNTKGVKKHVNQHCLSEQRCRCAYCEALLQKGANFIEHFAPKAVHSASSYLSAFGCLKPPNSPHVVWNLPVMPRNCFPSVRE